MRRDHTDFGGKGQSSAAAAARISAAGGNSGQEVRLNCRFCAYGGIGGSVSSSAGLDGRADRQ
jgi:hypothetical protein